MILCQKPPFATEKQNWSVSGWYYLLEYTWNDSGIGQMQGTCDAQENNA